MGKKESSEVRMLGVLPSQGADPIPVGKIPDGGTQVFEYTVTTNQTNTVYTVTAGKTLYLSSVVISIRNVSGGPGSVYVRIKDDGDAVKWYVMYSRSQDDVYVATPYLFFPPIELPAGWYIEADTDTANVVMTTAIHGYEA